jgi:signal transduction histidine kinase
LPLIGLHAAISFSATVLGIYVCVSLLGFLGLPRWKQHRQLIFLAGIAALFALLDIGLAADLGAFWHVQSARVQIVAAGFFVRAWLEYAAVDLGPLPGSQQRYAALAGPVAGVVYAIPGLGLTGREQSLRVEWLQTTYHPVVTRPLGDLAYVVLCGLLVSVCARYWIAWRRGRPGALVHFASLALLIACAVNDALAVMAGLPLPRLLDIGYSASVCLLALVLTRRWASDAQALHLLTEGLEETVLQRTRALADSQLSLSRAERLAAVGRLAGGMAHEINNPAAALLANVDCLRVHRERGHTPEDLGDILNEMHDSTQRISQTVRELLVLSRAAEADADGSSFEVAEAAQRAAAQVQRRLGKQVAVELRLPPGLVARGRGHLLEQVLLQLLSNAVQAASGCPGGRVSVEADSVGDQVRVRVSDNGPGMDEQVRARLFEPYFTTSPNSGAKGMGLAISLGLMRALGGRIEVETAPGQGTVIALMLELPNRESRTAA